MKSAAAISATLLLLNRYFMVYAIVVPRSPFVFYALRGGGEEDEKVPGETAQVDKQKQRDVAEIESGSPEEEISREAFPEVVAETVSSDATEVLSSEGINVEAEDGESSLTTRAEQSSELIEKIVSPHDVENQESLLLRRLLSDKADEYIESLRVLSEGEKPPHPQKVLHSFAPKIQAIRQSPDYMLRIRSARSVDAGVAACAIGTIARVTELYEIQRDHDTRSHEYNSVCKEIFSDRRYEQLVECLVCGVDVRRRMREEFERLRDSRSESGKPSITSENLADGEQIDALEEDEEDAQIDEGLTVQDACRGAWGIALLGGSESREIGGQQSFDILTALSLRCRELLLARAHSLQIEGGSKSDVAELAKDATFAMWAFACVKACTGVRSDFLIDGCCHILCKSTVPDRNAEMDDIVEKLVKSESLEITETEEACGIGTDSTIDVDADGLEQEMTGLPTANRKKIAVQKFSTKDEPPTRFLDKIAPGEVTNVLWALASHGSPEGSSEIGGGNEGRTHLVEEASKRMLSILRKDFEKLQSLTAPTPSDDVVVPKKDGIDGIGLRKDGASSEILTQRERVEEIGMVEVVDAASLLALEESNSEKLNLTKEMIIPAVPVGLAAIGTREEASLYKSSTTDAHQEFEVVDAASLIASETNGSVDCKTEVIITSVPESTEYPCEPRIAEDSLDPKVENEAILLLERTKYLSFSLQDLCSGAWAICELQASSRADVVALVISIFTQLGHDSINALTGGDLSNLAWSAAKTDETDFDGFAKVTKWIAARALLLMKEAEEQSISTRSQSFLMHFQPPELSRLMWSLSSMIHLSDSVDDEVLSDLATSALLVVGPHISMFSAEDLAIVSWAFIELTANSTQTYDIEMNRILGKMLALIEVSLLRWERGEYSSDKKEVKESESEAMDIMSFTPFFGRSRSKVKLLDHKIGVYQEDEEERQPEPGRMLPYLRDLRIDPATLCKLSDALSRFDGTLCLNGSWTVLRVAVRLLVSRKGHLLNECKLADIVRLCSALARMSTAAGGELRGEDRVLVQSLLPRRVVHLLNDAFQNNSDRASLVLDLKNLPPHLVAHFLWSLGELGVHFGSSHDQTLLHNRKLNLDLMNEVLGSDIPRSMSSSSIVKMLQGVICMCMIPRDSALLLEVLSIALEKSTSISSVAYFCLLAECVSAVQQVLRTASIPPATGTTSKEAEKVSADAEEKPGAQKENEKEEETEILSTLKEKEIAAESVIESLSSNSEDINEVSLQIRKKCEDIMSTIADLVVTKLPSARPLELRRLVQVYAILPFEADDFVEEIEIEVNARLLKLQGSDSSITSKGIENLIQEAANQAIEAANTLSPTEDDKTRISSLAEGIRAFFTGKLQAQEEQIDDGETREENGPDLERIADQINNAARATSKAASRMASLKRAMLIDIDSQLNSYQKQAALELGRCQEFIDSYRRVEFKTGTRRTRYDEKRRRLIKKRVLSRLFQ